MNYLTQYYKNRCDQLQEQISQINNGLRNLSEYAVAQDIGVAKPGQSTGSVYGGGGPSADVISDFMSRWGQPGYDGEGLGRLLGSMVQGNDQTGEAQTSGGNGVGAAAQRIMAGKNPASMSQAGGGNDVDKFFGQIASQGQGGNGSAFSGAALGQILAAQGGAAGQAYANQFAAGQAGKGIPQTAGFRPGDKRRRV